MHRSIGHRVSLALLFALLLAGCAGSPASLAGRAENPTAAVEGTAISPGKATPAETVQQSQSLDAALAELEELPAPEGVDTDVFTELKEALAQALTERFAAGEMDAGGKLASTPPMDSRSVSAVYFHPYSDTLTWRHFSTGDYNQDGFVTIHDLTPLGQNYLRNAPDNPVIALHGVDGNGDGLITINDITQIGQNFGDNVVSYNVYASSNEEDYPESANDDNGEALLLGDIAFSEATEPALERKVLSFTVPAYEVGQYAWVRPVDKDGQEGIATEFLQFPPNVEPFLRVENDINEGPVPLTVAFDASQSFDTDGWVAEYQWDWDGPGDEWDWESTGDIPTTEITYEFGKEYAVVVRIIDNDGGFVEGEVPINAFPSWHTVLVTTTPSTSGFDMNLVNGMPAIAYNRWEDDGEEAWSRVGYVRATNDMGLEWGAPQTINDGFLFPIVTDQHDWNLVETDEHPAVFWTVYEAAFPSNYVAIYVQSATDPDGDTWLPEQQLVEVEYTDESGIQLGWPYGQTTGVLNGNLAWGFPVYDESSNTQNGYRLYLALDGIGTAWSDTWMNPRTSRYGNGTFHTSDGNPSCHLMGGVSIFGYSGWSRAFDSEGGTWPAPAVCPSGGVASHASVIGGIPAIVELDYIYPELISVLIYYSAQDERGENWNDGVVMVGTDLAGGVWPSLHEVQGKPAVSYCTHLSAEEDHKLYYLQANDAQGLDWPESELVLAQSNSLSATMEVVCGYPAIAYASSLGGGEGTELYYTIKY